MITYRKYLEFKFEEKITVKNITNHVEMILQESNIKNGIIIISPQHTTTAVFINDDEEGLLQDILELLEKIVPTEDESSYKHNRYEEDATAHLKRILLGRSEIVSVTDGKLDLGKWEDVFYVDFWGMRNKKLCIKIIGE